MDAILRCDRPAAVVSHPNRYWAPRGYAPATARSVACSKSSHNTTGSSSGSGVRVTVIFFLEMRDGHSGCAAQVFGYH